MGNPLKLFSPEKPKVTKPKEPQKTQLDPNRSASIAAARRKAQSQAASGGRSSFRIDLNAGVADAATTRGGLVVQ